MKKFFEDFKKFAFKGNVIDMAVGVIIGGAFGTIVSSLVADIIMPLIGLITGDLNFADMKIVLKTATETLEDGRVVETVTNSINYGMFIQNIVYFLIVAISIFIVIKAITKASEIANRKKIEAQKAEEEAKKKEEEEKKAAEITPEKLLTEIRDLLKESKGK